MLSVLAYQACGGEDKEKALNLALSGELIHTATLVHDDINDQSKLRRGKPTLHTQHRNHMPLSQATIFSHWASDWVGTMTTEWWNASPVLVEESQQRLLQMEHIGNLSTTPEDYYAIVDGKTAGPFASACWGAAIAAEAEIYADSMDIFGMELGRAFQLVDDLLDLTGDPAMGKPEITDVHDGR